MDELAVLRISKNNDAIEDCTFRPNVRQHFVGNTQQDSRDERTEKQLYNARWNHDEKHSHRGAKLGQARCEELYKEASSKYHLIDSMHKMGMRQREKDELQECTFRPFIHLKSGDKGVDKEKEKGKDKEKLEVKGEGVKIDGKGKENNRKEVRTETREKNEHRKD
jgi:hypothetical protein